MIQPIRIILDNAPEKINIPESFRRQRIEVTFWPLGLSDEKPIENTPQDMVDITNACGVLQAARTVSLSQMNTTIKQRGGTL